VQAYVRKDGVGDGGWALLENLDLGDHVGVTGVVFRTRTGELSVKAESLTFLAKCLRPSPTSGTG
jgi:Lysyl-tRNA synthetase (class II)